MSSRSLDRLVRAALVFGVLLVGACERETRRFREEPPAALAPPAVTYDHELQAGSRRVEPAAVNPYEHNSWAQSEGRLLFEQFNCSGCHSPRGGGNIGPALMDSAWIYGSHPEDIFASIVEGRPDGMPSYRERLGNAEVWKLVTYVRSLSSNTPTDTRAARADAIRLSGPDLQADRREPMGDRRARATIPDAERD